MTTPILDTLVCLVIGFCLAPIVWWLWRDEDRAERLRKQAAEAEEGE